MIYFITQSFRFSAPDTKTSIDVDIPITSLYNPA